MLIVWSRNYSRLHKRLKCKMTCIDWSPSTEFRSWGYSYRVSRPPKSSSILQIATVSYTWPIKTFEFIMAVYVVDILSKRKHEDWFQYHNTYNLCARGVRGQKFPPSKEDARGATVYKFFIYPPPPLLAPWRKSPMYNPCLALKCTRMKFW